MIDLSYLTEEEQANVLRVLQRDAELRKVEEKRIRQLNIKNEIQRKNMTGEWFYKAKAKRHKDTLHGAELIQASMRKKKPLTIYERLQANEFKEKSSSFLKNAGSSIFIPPELSFYLQEPKLEEPQTSTTSQKENHAHPQQQPMRRKISPSPGKQRENPFNKSILSSDYPNEDERSPLSIGNQSSTMQESLSHPKDNISRLHFSSNDHSPAEKNSEMRPVAKSRTIFAKLQGPSDDLSIASGPKNWNGLHGNSSTPKSILKRSPSTSSNDSEILRIGVQDSKNKVPASQTIPEGATEPNETVANEESFENNNLEKLKQVRFSTNVDEKRISQTQEHYEINKISKIGEDNILDTDYIEEINEKNTGGMDSAEENGSLQEDSVVSDLHHIPPYLQTDFVHLNQEDVNAVSDTDFQSIQATNSNPKKYSDSHLPSDSSSKLTNQAHELYTGEMLIEKKPSRRLNSTSNPSNYSVDKQILHTDFESPQVSDQQRPEIFQGKRVNFAVPLSKTAPAEQRLKAHSSKSQVHDRYTTQHIKATDESISKVLDWFTRSQAMPSAKLEEMKSPIETKVESIPKPIKTVLPKTDTKYKHIEPALFTEDPQLLPFLNYEIQGKDEQEIQLQDIQTKIKNNLFDKSEIADSMLLEDRSKTGTKDVTGIADTVSNDKQQDLNQEQNEESEQGPLILKPLNEKRSVGIRENTGGEFESIESASEDIDVLPIATIENSVQESKSRPEQTKFSIEGPKIVPTKDIKKDIFPTFQTSSPTDKTSYDKNAFANAVFGKSSKKENIYSINGRSALLANKGNDPTETMSSTFPSNGDEQELAQSKTKEEQSDVELDRQKINRNKKEQIKCEESFLENERQRQNQARDKSANGTVLIENTTLCNLETSPSTKQNKQETNILQLNRNVNVPEVEQTLNKEENTTEVNLNLDGNDTNITLEDSKPFTIVSIKKRIYEASDNSLLNNTQFTNLMNFWDKGTESSNCNDDKAMFTKTPGDKSLSTQAVKGVEPRFPLELQPLPTQNSARVQRTTQTSNFETPEEPIKNEWKKPQSHKGPTVNEIMQQLCQQNQTESVKKRLDTKYFPKVLPTDPKEIQAKRKKMPDVSIEGLSPASSIFHRQSSEVEEDTEENTTGQPKLNTSNIGLHKLLQEEDESEALTRDELNEDGGELPSKDQSSMLRDAEAVNGQNGSNLIKNKEEQHILEKSGGNVESLDNRIQFIPKSIGISYQDEKIPVRQTSSDAMSNNEGNLTLFTGGSRLIEENYIFQEKLNKFDSSASTIQTNLNTADVPLQEGLSPIKSDTEAIYDEISGVDLDTNNKGFEFQGEFEPRLNLPSGMTRTSTFKESDDGSMDIPKEILNSETPYNVKQEAKNTVSDYSGGNGHLPMETRSSLNDEDTTRVAWKINPQTSKTSKSLQDLNTIDSMPSALDSQNKEMVLSAVDVSNFPATPENTSLQSKTLKRLSQSVPALAENDDADSLSEQSFQMNKHGTIASSLTNISSSPGMTSRSSVSGSTMSIYSGDFGNIDVRGKIQFSLDYVDKLKEFHIFVVRCSDLAAADEKKNRSDPYVKSYLLPDKVKLGKKKTSVRKKNLNPIYNEILRYKVEKNVLMAQTLNLSVWHNDTFGRNSFLGEVAVELEKWNWNNKQMEWYNLKPRAVSAYTMNNKGTLKVAFRYIPQGHRGKKTGEVQIWVKEANNLPQVRAHRMDPFVKCFILPDTRSKSHQKTRVVKKTRNPNFNHTMVYDGFGLEDLKDACVELSVWDHDKLINHFLGGLRFGYGTGKSYGMTVDWMDSTKEETQVWNKMITQPNIWVEDVLPLRMLMLSKNSTN